RRRPVGAGRSRLPGGRGDVLSVPQLRHHAERVHLHRRTGPDALAARAGRRRAAVGTECCAARCERGLTVRHVFEAGRRAAGASLPSSWGDVCHDGNPTFTRRAVGTATRRARTMPLSFEGGRRWTWV